MSSTLVRVGGVAAVIASLLIVGQQAFDLDVGFCAFRRPAK